MKQFVMLVGLPGSGKSTFRKMLKGEFEVLSSDDYIDRMAALDGVSYDVAYPEHAEDANNLFWCQLHDSLTLGKDIIVDRTNLDVVARDKIMIGVPDQYLTVAVYFEIPEDVRQARVSARAGKAIPADVDAAMRAKYVRPSTEEGFDVVLSAKSFAHVVAYA